MVQELNATNLQEAIDNVVAGHGRMYLPTAWRLTVIDAKSIKRWEAAGRTLLKPDADGRGIRMARGRSTVYIYAGNLKYRAE